MLVLVTRLGVAPISKSRSKCLSCGEALRISDLVPVLSYLFLRGRCRYCKVPYGKSALLVEAGFGVLFMVLYKIILMHSLLTTALLWLVFYTLLFVSLGVIALYDLRHTYVPVSYLVVFLVLSCIMLAMRYIEEPTPMTLLGPLVVALPFLLIWIISKGRALGFGDVVLFAGVGGFLGIEQGLAVLLVSVWLGAIIGILMYMVRQWKGQVGRSTAIPFVPFIVLGFLIVLFTDTSIFSIASYFS